MSLPKFQSDSKELSLLQTNWASQIDPVINLPINRGSILKNIHLISGTTVVNHKLGRKLQGWFIVRQRASALVYDAQDTNQMPDLTLDLVSNNAVVCDIFVF